MQLYSFQGHAIEVVRSQFFEFGHPGHANRKISNSALDNKSLTNWPVYMMCNILLGILVSPVLPNAP